MSKTDKPTGLSIKRDGNKFTCNWKIGDSDYGDGQWCEQKINKGKWKNKKIGIKATSKKFDIDLSERYPHKTDGKVGKKVDSLSFRVQGDRKQYTKGSGKKKKTINPSKSDWADKTFKLAVPNKPSITAEVDTTHWNRTVFSWNVVTNTSDAKVFTDVMYQTCLIQNCQWEKGESVPSSFWTGEDTGGASGSQLYDEAGTVQDGSWTRWFRICSRGPKGDSTFVYEKHVYAAPKPVQGLGASVKTNEAGGLDIEADWESPSDLSKPVDKIVPQYAVVTPDRGMACPAGASWIDLPASYDTNSPDKCIFTIDGTIGYDQCIFMRVNTYHDQNVTYGTPKLVKNGIGELTPPDNINVSINESTHTATISANNNSSVSDSFLVITYRCKNVSEDTDVGIITSSSPAICKCPDWTDKTPVSFGVRAVVGKHTKKNRADGADAYAIKAQMSSEQIWEGGAVPVAPTNVEVDRTDISGTIRVTWDWPWESADSAELSWSDHEDAWESTDEPDKYVISKMHAAAWNISGLATGMRWYVRVRLIKGTGEDVTYGPYSEARHIDLSSAPVKPLLMLSKGIITKDDSVTASWVYNSTDGTGQAYADVYEVSYVNGAPVYGKQLAHVKTAQHVTINAEKAGWSTGSTYLVAVRTASASGRVSDEFSEPVGVTIADPLVCNIVQHNFQNITIIEDGESRNIPNAMLAFPLTITVTGAGVSGKTRLVIERAEAFHLDRPDGDVLNGHDGETIFLYEQDGEAPVTITRDSENILGSFDDGASYNLIATVQDSLGQSDSMILPFEVHWSHQAVVPEGIVVINNDIAELTPVEPQGAGEGDTCDIYRLSTDKPELIVENAAWGTTYVDPYPAIGAFGGYRFVLRTIDGDYITQDDRLAFLDVDADYESDAVIIDFDGEQVRLPYNIKLSSEWEKGFKEIQFLGGTVKGYWKSGIKRKTKIDAISMILENPDTILAMRSLARYHGICHVRTPEGSSFAADVQVSENEGYDMAGKIASFSMSVTAVAPEGFDGMTLEKWQEQQEEE